MKSIPTLNLYPEDTLEKLDFDAIQNEIQYFCYGSLGINYIKNQDFFTTHAELHAALKQVVEFKDILENDSFFPDQGYDELPFLKKIKIEGSSLQSLEFILLLRLLKAFQGILYFFAQKKREGVYPHLESLVKDVYWDAKLVAEIERVIDIENENVRETASENLGIIRRKITRVERQQLGEFAKVLRRYRSLDYLAEQGEGVRGGKKVLAVKAEYKRVVPGIYLDDSASGTIAFIEPQETVTLNNEYNSLKREEAREIERILRELTAVARPHLKSFYIYQEILAHYDATRAKALLAIKLDAHAPVISESGEYHLFQFRHPVLYLNYEKQGREVIANTLILEPQERILLISGPNAGGKSIVLKSVGLIQLMFQFGMPVPADPGSKLPIFKQLFVDIGDSQSVENDLSTYSSHLKSMKYFTEHAHHETLVLLDELGHGTDPILGGAMAEAVMETLLDKQVYSVVTTHYANLKAWGSRTDGVQNGAMSFDKKHLEPLYQLNIGSPGSSFTFEIATKSGLNPQIIQQAKDKVGEQNKEMEISLTEIQHEKQHVKGLRKALQQREKQLAGLQKTYELLKRNLEKEKRHLMNDFKANALEEFNQYNRELEKLMRNWKEDKKSKEKFLKARKFIDQTRTELEKEQPITEIEEQIIQIEDDVIDVGSKVKMKNGMMVGEVVEMRKNRAVVNFGNMTSLVHVDKLVKTQNNKTRIQAPIVNTAQKLSAQAAFKTEIDLRGKMKDEALVDLEDFLDKALMFGSDRLRIIHGRGTGAVRLIVHQTLKKHPSVENFEFESAEFGGDGVTLVDLK